MPQMSVLPVVDVPTLQYCAWQAVLAQSEHANKVVFNVFLFMCTIIVLVSLFRVQRLLQAYALELPGGFPAFYQGCFFRVGRDGWKHQRESILLVCPIEVCEPGRQGYANSSPRRRLPVLGLDVCFGCCSHPSATSIGKVHSMIVPHDVRHTRSIVTPSSLLSSTGGTAIVFSPCSNKGHVSMLMVHFFPNIL